MRALVIANGEPVSSELLHLLAAGADIVVAADGGLRHAFDADVPVEAVVGDLDSLSEDDYRRLPSSAIQQDTNPNGTDLEKAVAYAFSRGASQVDVTCAGGGRADHALANLSILVTYRGRGILRLIDDRFEISLVDRKVSVEGAPGTVVSLVAIGECTGVTTSGLRWDLNDYTLRFSAYGVHNELATGSATVAVASGNLLLFRGRWVEQHR